MVAKGLWIDWLYLSYSCIFFIIFIQSLVTINENRFAERKIPKVPQSLSS